MCAVLSNVSQHYETTLPGSECVYTANGSNVCKDCLDLNCSIVVSVSNAMVTLALEASVLPCHDGNLDVPIHAIDSRILIADGKELFGRLSNQSFNASFVLLVPVFVSATIENRGNGVFFQASKEHSVGSITTYKHYYVDTFTL